MKWKKLITSKILWISWLSFFLIIFLILGFSIGWQYFLTKPSQIDRTNYSIQIDSDGISDFTFSFSDNFGEHFEIEISAEYEINCSLYTMEFYMEYTSCFSDFNGYINRGCPILYWENISSINNMDNGTLTYIQNKIRCTKEYCGEFYMIMRGIPLSNVNFTIVRYTYGE